MKIVENRKKFFALSILVILAGIVTMVMNMNAGKGALNWDVEFTGGTSINVNIGQEFENDDIASIITEKTGQKSPQIQKIVGSQEVAIKIQSVDGETRTAITNALREKYDLGDEVEFEVGDVSGTVSGEMQQAAIKAIMVACFAMLVYISIRFKDLRAGLSAIIALLHDILIVLGAYAILRIPINYAFIAVLLTILGYSINSTIVIFDRIRENAPKFRKYQTVEKIDKSVSQTLARSINTSITTLLTIGAIYLLGVQSIKDFSLPMIVGICAGAYSSIFISGSVWYLLLPKKEKQ